MQVYNKVIVKCYVSYHPISEYQCTAPQ